MAIPIAAAFNVLLNERLLAHEEAAGEGPLDAAAAPTPGRRRGELAVRP